MSLYLTTNKPRSLHRQPPTYTSHDSPIPPKLEHTLGEWLGQTNNSYSHFMSSDKTGHCLIPQSSLGSLSQNDSQLTQPQLSTSPPPLLMSSSCSSPVILSSEQQQQQQLTSCPCCQLSQCKAWKKIASTVQKLETETCLAAEIGQSLLQKNENCRMESNELKTKLKHYQERIYELETSLADSESFARQMNWEKEKWKRQGERSEKNLNRSMKDMEMAHTKYTILAKELQQAKHKVETLELFKTKSQQFDVREEALKLEIEEIKNELAISRKNEINLTLENKILNKANDILSWTHQDLFSKYSTQKFNSKNIKPSPSSSSPAIGATTPAARNEWITMINKLQSENTGLQCELINTTTRLDNTRNEVIALEDKFKPAPWNQYLNTMLDENPTSDIKEMHITRRRSLRHMGTIKRTNFGDSITPKPQQSHPMCVRTSVSSPLLHHLSGTKSTSSYKTTTMSKQHSTSLTNTTLLNQTRDILRRLRSTDMRKLNRRLRRTFDIEKLSQMSDTLLKNIMTDVDTMDARFFWLAPDENDDDDDNDNDDNDDDDKRWVSSADDFASLVHLLQELLHEIAQSSMTINQLQVAYVKKVEENDARIRQDVLGNQLEQSLMGDTPLLLDALTPCNETSINDYSSVMGQDSDSQQRSMGSSARNGSGNDLPTTKTDNSILDGSRDDTKSKSSKCRSQTHHPSHCHNYNNTFWESIFSSIMDEWHLMATKNTSSSLDREWLFWNWSDDVAPWWTCND